MTGRVRDLLLLVLLTLQLPAVAAEQTLTEIPGNVTAPDFALHISIRRYGH